MTRIVIVQGHPDPEGKRFCRTLASAYAEGARASAHEVDVIDVARLQFPLLASKSDWEGGTPPESIRRAQQAIHKADHLVLIYPIWLGDVPALLKGFLEQVLRPGFALSRPDGSGLPKKLMAGRSVRVVVTMGMPAPFYRFYFMSHSLKSLRRNVLSFCGFSPIRESLIGLVEAKDGSAREAWLAKMRKFGRKAI